VVRGVQEAAALKRVQLRILQTTAEAEIDTAIASTSELGIAGLVVVPDPFLYSRRERLLGLVTGHAVPAIYPWREFVAAGGLISYGPSLTAAFRQVGIYVGKILKGANPADLPVEQSTKLELVINANTASALGLTIPQSILARADEVIE